MAEIEVSRDVFKAGMFGLSALAILLLGFNQYSLWNLQNSLSEGSSQLLSGDVGVAPGSTPVSTGDPVQDAVNIVVPRGVPEYGAEMGVTFEDPIGSINVLRTWDRGIATSSLTAEEKAKYVNIGTRPESHCEFCCGAPSMTDANGRLQCGCSHNVALSGLTKWLIWIRPGMTADQIFEEEQKWKAIWYPKDSVLKYLQRHGDPNDPNVQAALGSIPQMVGGC